MLAKFPALPERRVLVVEDDPLLGLHVKATLHEHGCLVIGPLRAVTPAVKIISPDRLDAAVLDVNLGDELSFPIADALTIARVPFLFLTAYNRAVLPIAHRLRPVLPKPFVALALVVELARILEA
jgi:DNA-binding response OmpR family regulator